MSVEFTVFKGSANEGIIESTTRRHGPTGNEVLVKITHSGICGTDEHFKLADMVLGHEGVGTVEQIGDRVSQFKVGDVVGWALTHRTCGECEQCWLGQDQYCPNREEYGSHNHHQGSFGSHAIWDASFLFKIPESATVFEVIDSYNIRPTDRVGVIGIGGLGHLAIQFLAKMGASVVAFSSTDSKREEALRLGATEFYATNGVESFEMAKLDHLMVTTSFLPDWKPFLSVMKPKSTIYPLTVSFTNLVIPLMPILVGGINIQGSAVSSRSAQKKMLNFAARNHITPIVEKFPLTKSGVEDAMARLREGKMRYKGVLVAA
ncbi:putative NADP-dependent alcohol dehydrogenase C 2 [Mycena olivaceomarginata]|nr:putative NADP-dependent alcohol dehydrogenase C 2 [Mycena olivaceomarginata]